LIEQIVAEKINFNNVIGEFAGIKTKKEVFKLSSQAKFF